MSLEQFFESNERKQVKAHFENMIDLAKADGEVSEEERAFLMKMARVFHITEEEFIKMLLNEDSYDFSPPVGKEERYTRFVNLVRLIVSDDVIDPFEIKALERFGAGLSLKLETLEHVIDGVIGAVTEGLDTDEIVTLMDDFTTAE